MGPDLYPADREVQEGVAELSSECLMTLPTPPMREHQQMLQFDGVLCGHKCLDKDAKGCYAQRTASQGRKLVWEVLGMPSWP